jgi:hypothetical protein
VLQEGAGVMDVIVRCAECNEYLEEHAINKTYADVEIYVVPCECVKEE